MHGRMTRVVVVVMMVVVVFLMIVAGMKPNLLILEKVHFQAMVPIVILQHGEVQVIIRIHFAIPGNILEQQTQSLQHVPNKAQAFLLVVFAHGQYI